MSRDGLAALSGLARRRRERQPLHQVEDLAGQPRREPGDTGDELGGPGRDDFRPALPYRADDLACGARRASAGIVMVPLRGRTAILVSK